MNKNPVKMQVIIPFRTLVVILATILVVNMIKLLAPLMMSAFLAALLAIALSPILNWLEARKLNRKIALTLLTLLVGAGFAGLIVVLVPRIYQEGGRLFGNLPAIKTQLLSHLPDQSPVHSFVERHFNSQELGSRLSNSSMLFNAGNMALGGIGEVAIIFVLTIYFVADAGRMFDWVKAFFAPPVQAKLQQTAVEVRDVVSAYIAGQFITSLLSAVYVVIALSVLKVPNVILLGTLAAVFDVIPVLGFFLAVIPAVLFALPRSPQTAILVVVLYLVYHGIENYLIVPAVYGNRLRVSSLVVLITLLAAGILAGIEGAIAVLPVVASYPIIERIWLKRYVGEQTVSEHAAIENAS